MVFLCLLGVPREAAADVLPDDLDTLLRSVVSVLPEWPANAANAEEPEGSGIVILDGRTVITAFHVVDRALSVRVRTSDGVIVTARVTGEDAASDLAVISIDEALSPLAFGGDTRVGEEVCAIGNAFGLGLSVTCGRVSAIHRAGVGFNSVEDFVQTDAAVNPGHSGGALVAADGTLVGVLSAIFTKTSDANIGVNFAVAAPLAARVAGDLVTSGRVAWNFGGAGLTTYPPRGATGEMAAEVLRIRAASAAERAGLQVGDRIVRAGDRRIRTPEEFRSVMARHAAGDTIEIVARRGGEDVHLRLDLD
jgi:S1-C subfamily serine protease